MSHIRPSSWFILWREQESAKKDEQPYKINQKIYHQIQTQQTSNNEFSGTFCLAKWVDCNDFVFSAVLWPHSENIHAAYAEGVGDVVVAVRVDTLIIEEPGHGGCWEPSHGTRHVDLVTFWWCTKLQRDQDGWGSLKADMHRVDSIVRDWNLTENKMND